CTTVHLNSNPNSESKRWIKVPSGGRPKRHGNHRMMDSFLAGTRSMAGGNHSGVTEFVLLGFTTVQELLFVVFFLFYITTLVGNLGMIALIRTDPHLHAPMYFFLSHLSFLDICYSSTITPKLLLGLLAEQKVISFHGCFTQLFFYSVFITTECFLLAVMAYDRYIAICNPLLYSTIMTCRQCVQLVVGSYIGGILNAIIQMAFIVRLPFCGSNIINHFFCDVPPLLALSCASTYTNEMILFSLAGIIELSTVAAILVSYIFISCAILRIRSAEGRQKALSTCASHLTAVTLLYGTTIFMYLRPSSSHSLNADKVVSVFYTVVIPMLNPLIYSLRNQEVKGALSRVVERITVRV
uniref:Olfactory receptor n=1 Tax=Pavo cristatus TaxID=9049 RepID=A0A8C9FT85_PAVCR